MGGNPVKSCKILRCAHPDNDGVVVVVRGIRVLEYAVRRHLHRSRLADVRAAAFAACQRLDVDVPPTPVSGQPVTGVSVHRYLVGENGDAGDCEIGGFCPVEIDDCLCYLYYLTCQCVYLYAYYYHAKDADDDKSSPPPLGWRHLLVHAADCQA